MICVDLSEDDWWEKNEVEMQLEEKIRRKGTNRK